MRYFNDNEIDIAEKSNIFNNGLWKPDVIKH